MNRRIRNFAVLKLKWNPRNWLRIKQIEAFEQFLAERPDAKVFEVSPGWNRYWKDRTSKYNSLDYPEFDICKESTRERYDIVIADQVLEHVQAPQEAVKNIYKIISPGGYAIVATPFLFRVHARPHDYQRWTEAGMRELLKEGGFKNEDIQTYSWGNKSCARAHIGGPVRDYGWYRNLKNDPEYPLMVWAFARKAKKKYKSK